MAALAHLKRRLRPCQRNVVINDYRSYPTSVNARRMKKTRLECIKTTPGYLLSRSRRSKNVAGTAGLQIAPPPAHSHEIYYSQENQVVRRAGKQEIPESLDKYYVERAPP